MIYLDVGGQGPGLIPAAQGLIPANDRGFLYGDGLFETLLACDGKLPLLGAHMGRLMQSAAILSIPCDTTAIADAARQVAQSAGSGEHALRITLSRGAAVQRGFTPPSSPCPTLLISSAPYRRPTGPLRAILATLRINPTSPLAGHKSLSALEKVLARAEAAQAGADEALLLNLAGRVAEGAASNLFLCRGGQWLTPALSEGCLPGVMRAKVIALLGATESSLTVEDLFTADAVYLTNSLMGALPLVTVDGRAIATAVQLVLPRDSSRLD
jgi:branched-chain amino acid aminotransferase